MTWLSVTREQGQKERNMGRTIDDLSVALASGLHRRQAVSILMAGTAALQPWASEGKKRRKKKKGSGRAQRYLDYCRLWCENRFGAGTSEAQACVSKAKEGRGACYSTSEKGPGWFCERLDCRDVVCCPLMTSGAIAYAQCCPPGFGCIVDANGPTGQCA